MVKEGYGLTSDWATINTKLNKLVVFYKTAAMHANINVC